MFNHTIYYHTSFAAARNRVNRNSMVSLLTATVRGRGGKIRHSSCQFNSRSQKEDWLDEVRVLAVAFKG